MSKVFKCKFCNKAYSAMRNLKQQGIFEDLKTIEVDPEVEALEPDVKPEVILKQLTKLT